MIPRSNAINIGCAAFAGVMVLLACIFVALTMRKATTDSERKVRHHRIRMAGRLVREYRAEFDRYPDVFQEKNGRRVSWRVTLLHELYENAPERLRELGAPQNLGFPLDATSRTPFYDGPRGSTVLAVIAVEGGPNWNRTAPGSSGENSVILLEGRIGAFDWTEALDLYYSADDVFLGKPGGRRVPLETLQDVFLLRKNGEIDYYSGPLSSEKLRNLLSQLSQ